MKHFLVYTVSYLSLANICYAQTCNPLPSCADLGYTTTAEEAATKSKCLPCPLDNNYYYCPDLCWEYTLTSCEGSSCKKCDYGDFYRIEVTAPLCEYIETTPPSGCLEAKSCIREGTTYYSTTCATCAEGWTASNGSCVANTCSGYGSSTTGCSAYDTCKSGNTTMYKCTGCQTNYQLSGYQCNYDDPNSCNDCSNLSSLSLSTSYTSCPGPSRGSCRLNGTLYYYCGECELILH